MEKIKNSLSELASVAKGLRTLLLWLTIFTAAFLLMWLFGKGDLHDFGLNALTETIGKRVTGKNWLPALDIISAIDKQIDLLS